MNDKLFREIAEKYTEQYGQALRDEQTMLDRSPGALPPTDRLERRVRQQIAAEKRRPYLRIITALAACLAIALFLPFAIRSGLFSPDVAGNSPPAQSDMSDSPAPTPAAAIPLSATLPAGFTESGFELDNGKSVYYIEHAYMDDVVITLENATLSDTSGLTAITLGDKVVYGTQTDSYNLLTFQRDEVVYELTCRYDINTLLELGEVFL